MLDPAFLFSIALFGGSIVGVAVMIWRERNKTFPEPSSDEEDNYWWSTR